MCLSKPSSMMEKRKEEARRRYDENAPGYPESMLIDLPMPISVVPVELELKFNFEAFK